MLLFLPAVPTPVIASEHHYTIFLKTFSGPIGGNGVEVGRRGWELQKGRFQFNCLNSESHSDLTVKQRYAIKYVTQLLLYIISISLYAL